MESALYQPYPEGLKLIETFGFSPEEGFAHLGAHLDRAESTALKLGFPFSRAETLGEIGQAAPNHPARMRLTIDQAGIIEITAHPLPPTPPLWHVVIAPYRLSVNDPWRAIKTTHRAQYDKDRSELPEGVDELIYLNDHGQLCEGTITNLFISDGAILLTPHLDAGVLPGVLRGHLLETGEAKEADLTLVDLKDAPEFFLGNSLRGLIKSTLI